MLLRIVGIYLVLLAAANVSSGVTTTLHNIKLAPEKGKLYHWFICLVGLVVAPVVLHFVSWRRYATVNKAIARNAIIFGSEDGQTPDETSSPRSVQSLVQPDPQTPERSGQESQNRQDNYWLTDHEGTFYTSIFPKFVTDENRDEFFAHVKVAAQASSARTEHQLNGLSQTEIVCQDCEYKEVFPCPIPKRYAHVLIFKHYKADHEDLIEERFGEQIPPVPTGPWGRAN